MRRLATECLLLSFTSVLIRMCIKYILEVLLDLDFTLEHEKKLIETVYVQALDLMYQFWDTNYWGFFNEFYGKFPYEYHKKSCFSVPTIIKHYGPYDG